MVCMTHKENAHQTAGIFTYGVQQNHNKLRFKSQL